MSKNLYPETCVLKPIHMSLYQVWTPKSGSLARCPDTIHQDALGISECSRRRWMLSSLVIGYAPSLAQVIDPMRPINHYHIRFGPRESQTANDRPLSHHIWTHGNYRPYIKCEYLYHVQETEYYGQPRPIMCVQEPIY